MVEVVSKSDDDVVQHIWTSMAAGNFSVQEDNSGLLSGEGELSRGTIIKIHLRHDCSEYLQEGRLHELVDRFSEYIRFPIYFVKSEDIDSNQNGGVSRENALISAPSLYIAVDPSLMRQYCTTQSM